MRRIRHHLTYANVMATIAVFVALGGGAYALDGRNSVDSGDIRKNAVKSSDIATNAAKGRDVAEGTLVIGAKSLRRVRQRSATDGIPLVALVRQASNAMRANSFSAAAATTREPM